MKITREIINGLDIDKYANELLSFGKKAYLEYLCKDHNLQSILILDNDKREKESLFSSGQISKHRYDQYLKALTNRKNKYKKRFEPFDIFINENQTTLKIIIAEKIEADQKIKGYLGELSTKQRFFENKCITDYVLIQCNYISNIINDINEISEYNLWFYNLNTQTIADDLERIKIVNKNIEATRIQEIEDKDFKTLTFILNNQFNYLFYTLGDEYRQTVISELIDLTVYKYLVDNNIQDLTTERTINIREKLLIAKDLGLFENEKYSKDPRKKNVISNSEFARQFAKIAGCSSHRVRAVYSQMRNNDEL